MKYLPLYLLSATLLILLTGCGTLGKSESKNVRYATQSDIQTMYAAFNAKVAENASSRDDFQLPDSFSQSVSNSGAHYFHKAKRAQIHNGAVINNGDGSPVMEQEITLVKSSTVATVSGANEATAGLVTAATDTQGNALQKPNGQPVYNFVSANASAGSGDTVVFGRDSDLRRAEGDKRAAQLDAAARHIEAYYNGAVKLSEKNGETLVSLIREGRETAIGVLQNVTPVGAAVLGAEKAVELLVNDGVGERTVEVPRPSSTN